MRGRTNIGDGGLSINGSKADYTVESGNTITEGDFVQFSDISTPDSIQGSVETRMGFYTFLLSDDKQVTFYMCTSDSNLYALVEEFDSSGVVSQRTIALGRYGGATQSKMFIIEGEQNHFYFFGNANLSSGTSGSTTYYYCNQDLYEIVYDPTNIEFSFTLIKSNITKYTMRTTKTSGSSTIPTEIPYLFVPKYLGNGKLFIAYVTYGKDSPTYQYGAQLYYILYDVTNNTELTYQYEATRFYDYDSVAREDSNLEYRSAFVGNYFIYCKESSSYSFTYLVAEINTTNNTITKKSFSMSQYVARILPLTSSKFLGFTKTTTCYLFEVSADGFEMIESFISPFVAYKFYYINSEVFMVNKWDSAQSHVDYLSNVVFDDTEDEVSFSGIQENVVYNPYQKVFDVAEEYFATYQASYDGIYRKIAVEDDGSVTPLTFTRKVKSYANRIDGVAETGGTGGSTISVFIPASS